MNEGNSLLATQFYGRRSIGYCISFHFPLFKSWAAFGFGKSEWSHMKSFEYDWQWNGAISLTMSPSRRRGVACASNTIPLSIVAHGSSSTLISWSFQYRPTSGSGASLEQIEWILRYSNLLRPRQLQAGPMKLGHGIITTLATIFFSKMKGWSYPPYSTLLHAYRFTPLFQELILIDLASNASKYAGSISGSMMCSSSRTQYPHAQVTARCILCTYQMRTTDAQKVRQEHSKSEHTIWIDVTSFNTDLLQLPQ